MNGYLLVTILLIFVLLALKFCGFISGSTTLISSSILITGGMIATAIKGNKY